MIISNFETKVVAVPREEGPLTGGMGNKAEFITIKINTDDGLTGIGYAGFACNLMIKALKESVDA